MPVPGALTRAWVACRTRKGARPAAGPAADAGGAAVLPKRPRGG